MFEASCDDSNHGIGIVLSQNSNQIEFFSAKLKQPQWNYSAYDTNYMQL